MHAPDKIKLLIITPGYLPMPPSEGGAVETLLNSFLHFNELNQTFEITCVSSSPKSNSSTIDNLLFCKFVYINTNSYWFLFKRLLLFILNRVYANKIGNAYILAVKRKLLLMNERFDIVLIENKPEFISQLRAIIDAKFVLHLHNDYISENIADCRALFSRYDTVYAASKFLVKRVYSIESSSDVKLLYNGINLDRFSCHKSNLISMRKAFSIAPNDIVILYSGRLTESKGIGYLIDAFLSIYDRQNVKLLIAGSVGFGVTIKNRFVKKLLVRTKFASDRIFFLGYVDYEKIPEIYSISDIGVVPSVAPEGFSLTALEHLASSNPVITTGNGGIAELINSEVGIVVDSRSPADLVTGLREALLLLIDDPCLRVRMGEFAAIRAEQFSIDAYCKRLRCLLVGETIS